MFPDASCSSHGPGARCLIEDLIGRISKVLPKELVENKCSCFNLKTTQNLIVCSRGQAEVGGAFHFEAPLHSPAATS